MAALLLAIIYLAFISLGLPDSLLGSAWPVMHVELGVQLSWMGIVTMIISCGTIVSSLASDFLTRKLGVGVVTAVSVLMTAGAMLGFSFATKFWVLCIIAIPYGLGAGGVDAALNNYVALHYKSRHMSWLHCFWGVGTIVSPFVMGACLSGSAGWEGGYRIVSYLQMGLTVLLFCCLSLWKKPQGGNGAAKALTLPQTFGLKGVIFLLIAFFCYCALESTMIHWTSSYLVEARGSGAERAASLASLFFIGMTAGRFISGFVTEKLGDKRLIRIGMGIIALGIVLLAVPFPSDVSALVAFVVIGLGCAPVYPSIIHATPFNFGAENSQAVIGVEMAFAYLGSTFMPPLFGVIAQYLSISFLPLWLACFLVLVVVMTELCNRAVGKKTGTKIERIDF